MLNSAKKLLIRILTGANIAAVLLMWGCAASAYLNPTQAGTVWTLPGLVFPFFVIVNVLFCIAWMVFAWRRLWIPFLGMAGCIGTLYTYCPVNLPSPPPEGSIKFLSFNTMGFGANALNRDSVNAVAAYVRDSKADIVCLQEAGCGWKVWNEVLAILSPLYPHVERLHIGEKKGGMLACFSRYPILTAEPLIYASESNGSYLYRILLAPGDTLLVINNHLESNHLSIDDRERYKSLLEDPQEAPVKQNSRLLAGKVSRAGLMRANQADSIAALIDRNAGRSMVVCGDFNDTPVSYTRHTIAKRLTDTYRSTANGPGFSFNRDGILVRIDHLLCSPDWQPYACRVDRSIKASDHYPIWCYLKRKQ